MDVTTQISNLISQVKAMQNSYARNKVVSALENARVWSKELDDKFAGIADEREASHNLRGCSCDELGKRRDCPIHGKKT